MINSCRRADTYYMRHILYSPCTQILRIPNNGFKIVTFLNEVFVLWFGKCCDLNGLLIASNPAFPRFNLCQIKGLFDFITTNNP